MPARPEYNAVVQSATQSVSAPVQLGSPGFFTILVKHLPNSVTSAATYFLYYTYDESRGHIAHVQAPIRGSTLFVTLDTAGTYGSPS